MNNYYLQKIKNLEGSLNINLHDFIPMHFPKDETENYFRLTRDEKLTPAMEEKVETWDKEDRTNEEFYLDFIYTGITEIHEVKKLIKFLEQKKGGDWTYRFNGADAKRHFHSAKDANDNPDCIINNKTTGNIFAVELMDDNSGYAKQYGALDLRNRKSHCSKMESLRKHNENMKTYLMVSDYKNNAIGLLPVSKIVVIDEHYVNKRYRGRECTKIESNYEKYFHKLTSNQEYIA